MIPEIQSYLKQANPDFNSGFALFCKYSPNRILIESIGRRHDQGMLLYELEKISNSGFYSPIPGPTPMPTVQLIQAQAKEPEPAPVPAANNTVITVDPALKKALSFRTYDDRRTSRRDLPPDLQTEYDANSEAYRLRRGFHEKMKLAKTDKDRAYFRSQILETQEAINKRWKKIDDYLAKAAEETQERAFNEKSARAYISKALKADTITDARAAGVRARVKALLDHGCNITDETIQALKARNLV